MFEVTNSSARAASTGKGSGMIGSTFAGSTMGTRTMLGQKAHGGGRVLKEGGTYIQRSITASGQPRKIPLMAPPQAPTEPSSGGGASVGRKGSSSARYSSAPPPMRRSQYQYQHHHRHTSHSNQLGGHNQEAAAAAAVAAAAHRSPYHAPHGIYHSGRPASQYRVETF